MVEQPSMKYMEFASSHPTSMKHIFFKEDDGFLEARLVEIRNMDKLRYYSFIRRAILMHFGIKSNVNIPSQA